MGFYRIFPSADTYITNAAPLNDLSVRSTGSNHGRSPSLNVFARKGEINTTSIELARSLVKFNVTELSGKIYDEQSIPSSSVSYILKMYDMQTDDTLPSSYDLFVYPVSRSFDEGNGIDDDNNRDGGYANWMSASSTVSWTVTGSDYIEEEFGTGSQHFDLGDEDLEIDITDIVINWLTGAMGQYGLVVKMGETEETNGTNYYRKAFHSRESKYVARLPYIEARWANIKKDNRKNFAFDQDSTLYMYNLIRGQLTNVTSPVFVRLQDNIIGTSASYSEEFTASFVETGIYSASFNVDQPAHFSSSWHDIWFSGSKAYMTGTFQPLVLTGSDVNDKKEYVINVNNLQRQYRTDEKIRLIVNVRPRDYATHFGLLSSASLDIEKEYIEKLYYSIIDNERGDVVVPFGTGSTAYTQLSYNSDGNYCEMYMNSFVP